MFSLTGQAGSGKSTIAYTIAKQFENDDRTIKGVELGANFLCSRQFDETRRKTSIIPTLAYQLARKCKPYADALHLSDKFDTVNEGIAKQMKELLVRPWQQSRVSDDATPLYLIVIDALDEIDGRGGVECLSELLKAVKDLDLRGFKFLVTTRLDPEVVELCETFSSGAVCRLQDVPIGEATSDIEKYLKAQLPKLADSADLAELGRRVGGLFIYAATAVKYLTPRRSMTKTEQMTLLKKFLSEAPNSNSSKNAGSLIDDLYRQIMCEAFSQLEQEVLRSRLNVLYTCLCTVDRTSPQTIASLIPNGEEETAEVVLSDLHAVLYVKDNQVFWYHASFPDFIFTESRSNFSIKERFAFWCDEPAHQKMLAESCFNIMERGLHFNMANIKSSFLRDSAIAEELSQQISENISTNLRYCCLHWADHLRSTTSIDSGGLFGRFSDFLDNRVLFWVESMNLLGLPGRCYEMLQRAGQWVLKVRYMNSA